MVQIDRDFPQNNEYMHKSTRVDIH